MWELARPFGHEDMRSNFGAPRLANYGPLSPQATAAGERKSQKRRMRQRKKEVERNAGSDKGKNEGYRAPRPAFRFQEHAGLPQDPPSSLCPCNLHPAS